MQMELLMARVNALVSLMLTDGVQPSGLADNIFLDHYTRVSYSRTKDGIVGELDFIEDSCADQTVTLRYFYTHEKKIWRIEEQSGENTSVLWDRNSQEAQLLDEIMEIVTGCYTSQQMEAFVSAFPPYLRDKINMRHATNAI